MKTFYFLFGSEAVEAFEENGAKAVNFEKVSGALYRYEEGESPTLILESFSGWESYIELTKKDYQTICKKNKNFDLSDTN